MRLTRRNALVAAAFALATVSGLGGGMYLAGSRHGAAPDIPGLLWPQPKAIGHFALVDDHERPFDRGRLAGKWSFLFFGFTHCPDICPTTLATLANVAARLHAPVGGAPYQYVFVTVDPQRDTTAHLAEYVDYFDERFIGVRGDDEALAEFTRQLGVVWFRGEPDEEGRYLVDHTAAVMLVDPEVRLVGVFSAPHDAADIAARTARIRAFLEGGQRS